MSKSQTNEVREQKVKSTPFYKKAIFPWMILAVMTVYSVGIISGWMITRHYESTVDNAVSTAVQSASLKEQTPEQK